MRKLASIQQIAEIQPIENSDNLEHVRINGWWCVVKKDQFKVGDRCVYFEIDSVLPLWNCYEFLRKTCYVKKDWIEGFRIRTCKLRGALSQGLVMHVDDVLPKIALLERDVGDDLTRPLHIKKWDPPIPAQMAGEVKGDFPSFIPKTDQERIQNLSEDYIEIIKHHLFECTLKMDGTSCTIYFINDDSGTNGGICSRNFEMKINDANRDNLYCRVGLNILHRLQEYCQKHDCDLALQGEIVGPGIQGNRQKLDEVKFMLFDVYNIRRGKMLNSTRRTAVAEDLELEHVPYITASTFLRDCPASAILDQARNLSVIPGLKPHEHEGLVFKSYNDPSVSFKVINNDYLLKEQK